jgi:hypothetical protein
MTHKNTLVLAAMTLLLCSSLEAASPICNAAANENKVSWPNAENPVWEMCWLRPTRSSGARGSGLELRNIHFRGLLVMKRSHAPILFAEYRNSGLCYRDWKDIEASMLVEPAVRNVLGTPAIFSSTTSCDISASATASFGLCPFGVPGRTSQDCNGGGVAIENLAANAGFRITAQYEAAWYKYTSRYVFSPNGDIGVEFGFGNSDGTNNDLTHWHHNYWRFDFDIDGADRDQISLNGTKLSTEFASLRSAREAYSVTDNAGQFGYQINPGANDTLFPANESGRNFHTSDIIGTRYIANEYTDRGTTNNLNDCALLSGNLANGASIDGTDVVVYYRASVRDTTANNWPALGGGFAPQDSMVCKRAGPTLQLIGNFPITEGDFSIFKDSLE